MLIFKNSFRKIRKSLGRFLSLVFIVILGTSFFAGVRETSSDMIKTLDHYYDDTNLMDFKITSTMGLTQDDLTSIEEATEVDQIEGSYSFDTLINGKVVKVMSLNDNLNQPVLINGRMPKNDQECLVEDDFLEVGEKLVLGEEANDFVENKTYTVVGTVYSSEYIYDNKGISTIGSGTLDHYLYIPKDNFTLDYYTEIYLTAKGSKEKISYSSAYDDVIETVNSKLQELKPLRETARYEEILKEAMDQISKAENEMASIRQENDAKFQEAKQTLEQQRATLEDAQIQYEDAIVTLQNQKSTTETQLNNGFAQLELAKQEFTTQLANYQLTEETLTSRFQELKTTISSLNQQLEQLDPSSEEYKNVQEQITTLSNTLSQLELLITTQEQLKVQEEQLQTQKQQWLSTYQKVQTELNSSWQSISDGQKKLASGYQEYEDNYQQYVTELANFEQKIVDAKEEVATIEKPVWYLLTRADNIGYTSFYESATKVDSIAQVFPVFFILIAFLMGLNTMTRMIEEERGEIGSFVSLGIRKSTIALSYLFYVLFACIIGLIVGLTIGYSTIPRILYTVYSAAFTLPSLSTYANPYACLLIIFTTLVLMSLVVILGLSKTFRLVPATILRPEAPKIGKKTLLEKIPFLWNRLSFSWKVTMRNLFRYKKRIIMTVIGIAGCTALLLTGFGIKDSLNDLMQKQFEEIQLYDATILLNEKEEIDQETITKFFDQQNITDYLATHIESFTFKAQNKNLSFSLVAVIDDKPMDDFIVLNDLNGNALELSDNGVIITQKMAEMLDVKIGENIAIRNTDNELYFVNVAAICENYINNYLYMNETYYHKIFTDTSYNSYLVNLDSNIDKETLATQVMNQNTFSMIQYTEDNMDMFEDIIAGMNNIVYLIIAFSTFLAITVLYNLTIININERRREIATLKVLGFHDKEVSIYVYRETIILTILGILVGILFGFSLNAFVLMIAETDEILFTKEITLLSYFISFLIIILFSIIVQIVTHFILKKIDMLDSLQSVE